MGLDDDLFRFPSPGDCYRSVEDFINYVLCLNGSDFIVDAVYEDKHNHRSVPI